MLFNPAVPPPQVARSRCRNPRCAGKLKSPVENPRDAFCCAGCETQYYRCRCRVCGQLFSRKTKRRVVCSREKCRYAFKTHPERFFGSGSITSQNYKIAHNDARSAHSTGLKTGAKSDRPWRVGPAADLHPINLHLFPANAAAFKTGHPTSTIFRRDVPPLNVVGGFKFPGAPSIDLVFGAVTSAEED